MMSRKKYSVRHKLFQHHSVIHYVCLDCHYFCIYNKYSRSMVQNIKLSSMPGPFKQYIHTNEYYFRLNKRMREKKLLAYLKFHSQIHNFSLHAPYKNKQHFHTTIFFFLHFCFNYFFFVLL